MARDPTTPDAGRRRLLGAGTAAALATPFLALGAQRVFGAAGPAYSTRTVDLMRRSLVIDMLSPLRLDMSDAAYAKPLGQAEAAAFRSSGITGFHNATGIGGLEARSEVLTYIAGWEGFAARNPELFTLVDKAADLEHAKAKGKIAVIIGIQDAEHFHTVEDVKLFHGLGQRCAQLTYNTQNLLGAGCTERVDGGVSDYGAEIIKAMGEVGMLVDVSHCGPRTTLDAIELAAGPIAITHANCRALNDHPRCKTDEAIKKLAAKGGVMGITGVRMFVSGHEPTTIEDVVDHIDHVAKLVGVEHVGIGSDADLAGYDALPADQRQQLHGFYKSSYGFRARDDIEGFAGPAKAFNLTEALVRAHRGDPRRQLPAPARHRLALRAGARAGAGPERFSRRASGSRCSPPPPACRRSSCRARRARRRPSCARRGRGWRGTAGRRRRGRRDAPRAPPRRWRR
jgi:membrane dipeptidase